MRFESYTMNVLPSGAGTALDCRHFRTRVLQLVGVAAAVATVQVEVSVDGTHFVSLGAAITADGVIELSTSAPLVRLNRTVAGAGTIVATLGGLNARVD